MNELLINFSEQLQNNIAVLTQNKRLPHSIIIQGKNTELVDKLSWYLAMFALCEDENKPCGKCSACKKIQALVHPDVQRVSGTGTNGRINVSDIRNLCSDMYVKPNEGLRKVYIVPDADSLNVQSQNAFLKSLEEPANNTIFLLQCISEYSLLETIRSRCVTIKVDNDINNNSEVKQKQFEIAVNIANAVCEKTEFPLLKATYFPGKDRDFYIGVIEQLKKIFAQACTGTYDECNNEISQRIKKNINISNIIKMIDVTDEAINALRRNANMNLLSTWLCASLKKAKEN